MLTVEIPNSSNEFLKTEFDLVEFKKNLNELKLIWQNTFQCKVSRTFSKFKYLLAKSDAEIIEKMGEIFSEKFVENYGMQNLKNKFQISKDLTYKIINLLLDYIKWSYNFENKSFENITLEKFGLECCYSCRNEDKK